MYCADRQYLANPRKPLVHAVFWGSTSGHLLAFRLGFAAYSTACTQRNDSTTKSTKSPNVWLRLTESWPLTSWERYIPCCTILERYIWLDKNGCLLITPVSVQLVEHRLITPTSGKPFLTNEKWNKYLMPDTRQAHWRSAVHNLSRHVAHAGRRWSLNGRNYTYIPNYKYVLHSYICIIRTKTKRPLEMHWKWPPLRYLSH